MNVKCSDCNKLFEMKINKIMENLIENYKNNKYFVINFNKSIPIPEKLELKNIIFYFVSWLYQINTNNNYHKEVINFVCIPEEIPKLKELKDYIEFVYQTKYNIPEEFIEIKNYDFKKLKIKELKKFLKLIKIKKYSKLKVIELRELVKNNTNYN
jgi:hypothetical protein